MAGQTPWDRFFGPNAGYALELYDRYQRDPAAVDAETRAIFEQLGPPEQSNGALAAAPAATAPVRVSGSAVASSRSEAALAARRYTAPDEAARIVSAARLARSIREYGHLAANIDPLGAPRPGDPMLNPATHGITEADLADLPATIVWRTAGPEAGTCRDAINRLRAFYMGTIGYDFDHVQDYDERDWLTKQVESGVLRQPLEVAERRALLQRLTDVEVFERFLHSTFQGQKRFSIEGVDALVPMLDEVIRLSAENGAREALIGMAHRGRLNVLTHVLGKPYSVIFSEFHHAPNKDLFPAEGSRGITQGWTGDVKYHLGAHKALREGDLVQIQLTLAHNPSHLEFVNPVVTGGTRAAQERRLERGLPRQDTDRAVCVTIHGDAAFPGEGIVAETLNLSRLRGYQIGGTIHIIANNQIGFTTPAREGRSTLYASDTAKGFEIPIIHVNADDPEACLAAVRLACAYREQFHKDFLIDLIGYRRWGHNEGDEPTYTQPLMYGKIAGHPTARAIYAGRLQALELVTKDEVEALVGQTQERLRAAYAEMEAGHLPDEPPPLADAPPLTSYRTAAPEPLLRAINEALLARPAGFTPNPKLERILLRRRDALDKPGGIDWGQAEALAFGAILTDGTPIRLTGQDAERGTFGHRHLILKDAETGASYSPLGALPEARASFAIYNSPLSEGAVIGFEYGYSSHASETLVLWEAQFGDFANAGQVLIDQFVASARAKWRREPSLVLLLPHGYEGQGPDHSSARLERYLQLAAQDNLRIVNPTTAAQYFHLLRAQAASLQNALRPLIVMTPKSLLRHPRAGASLADLTDGGFQPVLDDTAVSDRAAVTRLILCSGKVAVDLAGERPEDAGWVAVARVEQLFPFPADALRAVVAAYPNLREVVWVQEEPHNNGAWTSIAPRLAATLPPDLAARLRYIGRPEMASTAEGMPDAHAAEQARIIAAAYGGESGSRAVGQSGSDKVGVWSGRRESERAELS